VRGRLVVLLSGVLFLAGCTGGTNAGDLSSQPVESTLCGETLQEIIQAAQAEGSLTLLATPDDWANYRTIIDGFEADYGIAVEVVLPFASSAEELEYVAANAGKPGRPDVIDIGPSFTSEAIERGLVTAYKPTTWSQIPSSLKDADGYWIGTYFGLFTIGVNTAVVTEVPARWSDLEDPQYRGQVVLQNDPRKSGTAFAAVVAAALANGGSYDDITPGIDYFGRLAGLGNLRVEAIAPEGVLTGDYPIVLDWAYNLAPMRQDLAELDTELVIQVPRDGVYGSYYAQAITNDPEHPCAARLWMEHLLGDAAAIGRLNGLAKPARFAAIDAYDLIPPAVAEILPSSNAIYVLQFPTTAQLALMNQQLQEQWETKVQSRLG
jgi:putative spermidine/putrescine transport system substrate-binding protein